MTYSIAFVCQEKLFERGLANETIEATVAEAWRAGGALARGDGPRPTILRPPHRPADWASEIALRTGDASQLEPLARMAMVHLGHLSDLLLGRDRAFNDAGRIMWRAFHDCVKAREAYFTIGVGVILLSGSGGALPRLALVETPSLDALETTPHEPYVVRTARGSP